MVSRDTVTRLEPSGLVSTVDPFGMAKTASARPVSALAGVTAFPVCSKFPDGPDAWNAGGLFSGTVEQPAKTTPKERKKATNRGKEFRQQDSDCEQGNDRGGVFIEILQGEDRCDPGDADK